MALAKHPANWKAVRAEFESSPLSIRSIALKFNIPKTTLLTRIRTEQWQRSPVSNMTGLGGHGPEVQPTGPIETDPVAIAQVLLEILAEAVAQKNLDLKSAKSASDILSSCQKVIIAAGPAALPRSSYIAPELISVLSEAEQDIVQNILSAAEARLNEKITPMRKPV